MTRTLHFTYTGPLAGQVYCHKPRNAEDEYQHPAYDHETYAQQLARLCPDCLAVERGEEPE